MQFAGGSYTFYTGTGPVTVNTQSGAFGTACGFNSGLWNSGINNTSYGQSSLKYNNTGANNVAVGRQCMEGLSATDLSGSTYPITNSSSNIGIGLAALRRTYSASGNVAIGNNSMNSVGYNPSANLFATFTGNTGVGNGTLQKINTGSNNVAIGSGSANNLDSGNYNVFIGVNSGISEISGSNKLYIHSSSASTSTSAGALIYGDFANGQLYNVGNRILTSSNYGSLVTNVSELTIAGKLTVGGLIDPTGLELTPVAANPGIIPNNTLWTNSADSNRLYYGNAPVGTGGGDGVPVGSMIDYGGGTVEDGYLLCNGAAVSRSLFAELFAKIGTIHGNGDGFSTFNVPNMCRRVAVGSGGSGTSVLGSTVGNVGGEETHTLTLAESPSHFHTLVNDGFGNVIAHYGGGGFAGLLSWSSDSNGDASHPPFTNSQGGNGAHNNMQPSLVVTKMIKCSTLSPSGSVNKTVTGTLTVNGNINAGSGIQFTTQSSNPGNVDTLWVDNTNSLYFGSTPVVVSGGVSNIETLTTSVTDTSKVLKPDGVGGVTWGSGPIITDWVDAGPVTITAPTSNPTKGTTSRDKVWWRRVGDSMEVRIEYSQTSAGTQGSGAYQFLIPNSKSIDLSKSNVSNDNTGNSALYAPFSCVGTCIVVAGTSPGTNIGTGVVSVYDATHVRITAQDDGAADTRFVGSPGVEWFSLQWDATRYGITFTVPIVGWTATTGAT
jgi:microcystin-dependent protein